MKKTTLILLCLLTSSLLFAQKDVPFKPGVSLKWAPTGLYFGSATFQGEYNFGGKHSLTANIGIPSTARHSIDYEDRDANFNLKATTFMAGYRTYLSKKHMSGLYFEPYFKYVHHTSEGEGTGTLDNRQVVFNFTNDYNAMGVGAQLGAQFLIAERVVIDFFFLGPEINSARNTFKAIEKTNTVPWNHLQAQEAENDIRDFIDQFPFIRNNTTVMVDRDNRAVTADFKGALPGIRIGVSVGIAF